jgi:hypothetical protein
MTRRTLLDDYLAYVGATDDTRARNRAERALNRALEAIWLKHRWTAYLLPQPIEVTTEADVASYPLPLRFGRLSQQNGLIRNTTLSRNVDPIDPIDAPQERARTGAPNGYYIAGSVGCYLQPDSAGEALEVVSDDALDVAVRVFVEGLDENGNDRRVQVTLTGTSAVAVGTFSRVDRFGKSYPADIDPTTEFTSSAGTVTLRIVAGPSTLDSLSSDEAERTYQLLNLTPTPDAAYVLALDAMRPPRVMRYDAEPIPFQWENALFEEMVLHWRTMAGEIAIADAPRPYLVDLIAVDNANRPRPARRPFGGR